MKKIYISILMALTMGLLPAFAQEEGITQCGTPTGQAAFPLETYMELPDPDHGDGEAWKSLSRPQASWGSIDQRYAKKRIPQLKGNDRLRLEAWKGERVHAQAVAWTPETLDAFSFEIGEFKNRKGEMLPMETFKAGFVRYVLTDELNKDKKGGCGYRPDHTVFDSSLVADPIDHITPFLKVEANSTQAIWIDCTVPSDISSGLYKGRVRIKNGGAVLSELDLTIKVLDRTLPEPEDWKLHLDLWQNPYAVARYYKTELWSEEHFEAMKPVFELLAQSGQKVITASIMHKPWNGQTYDYFDSMVTWTKMLDGSWRFDYDIFDRWVEFMMSLGIDSQINCYTMIPWELTYQYFDQRNNCMKSVHTEPGDVEFEKMWVAMLKSFAAHLKEKGWFDITTIAMDERPMEAMMETIHVIRKADPDFKISLAGNWYEELDEYIYDYCIPIEAYYPEDALLRRKLAGKPSTYYTCCTEAHPNSFSFSAPAEGEWIGFYCAKEKVDGYLRWAFNSWPLEPLLDSRFDAWAGGDTYQVYPGARSSIRYERLRDGFQVYEKICLLRTEFEKTGNEKALSRLESILDKFNLNDFPAVPAEKTVNEAKRLLNTL